MYNIFISLVLMFVFNADASGSDVQIKAGTQVLCHNLLGKVISVKGDNLYKVQFSMLFEKKIQKISPYTRERSLNGCAIEVNNRYDNQLVTLSRSKSRRHQPHVLEIERVFSNGRAISRVVHSNSKSAKKNLYLVYTQDIEPLSKFDITNVKDDSQHWYHTLSSRSKVICNHTVGRIKKVISEGLVLFKPTHRLRRGELTRLDSETIIKKSLSMNFII